MFNNNNLANSKLKSKATNSTVRHTAIIHSKAESAESLNIKTSTATTATINQIDNLTRVNNNGLGKQLLLKKQLHLNLNGRVRDVTKLNKRNELVHPKYHEDSSVAEIHNVDFNYYKNYHYDNDKNNEEGRQDRRKHIVDNMQQSYVKSSPLSLTKSTSMLKSSPTVLAKFNRIIDATVPSSNVYLPTSQLQLQQEERNSNATTTTMALAYSKIVSEIKVETIKRNNNNNNNNKSKSELVVNKEENEFSKKNIDDNQIKRNDVHYLLKQLNSFSDIEKIEIFDMKKQKQEKLDKSDHECNSEENIEIYSPTTRSLELISPSALSHKGIRRYASLHQTQKKSPTNVVATSMSQQHIQPEARAGAVKYSSAMHQQRDQGVEWHQFDDYIFESCHYLETSHSTANYRTTMVESNSHEFRPSNTALTPASYSSHSSVHAYDLYEIEPASVVCETSPLPQQQSPNSISSQAQCHYHHNHHPYVTVHAQQPPVLGPPARRFQLQARLTSSGVQTELTPSSLSTAATNASLAKSYSSRSSGSTHSCSGSCKSRNSHATSANSSEVVFCRLMPIFKCCYTPIDRWCERRNAATKEAATLQKQRTSTHPITAVTMDINDLTKKK